MSAAFRPRSIRAGEAAAGDAGGQPPAGVVFLSLLPALLAGVLCLQAWARWMALPSTSQVLLEEVIVLARSLPQPGWAKASPAVHRTLYAHHVQVPEGADSALRASARFTNAGADAQAFVPLLVLSDEDGRELRESYAAAVHLRPGQSSTARFNLSLDGLVPGRYFVAVLPSHPDTGKRVGEGVYRMHVKVRCCARGRGMRARP